MKNFCWIVLFFLVFHFAEATTIHVGANYPVKKVKQAIAMAKPGDTIIVNKGTYREGNIIIDKKIIFLGKNRPVLDGQNKNEVLSVKADSVVVKGFKLINSGHAALEDPCGIKVYNKTFVRIYDNILDNNFFGIYLQNCNNCIVKGNTIVAYGKAEQLIGNGIHCWKSDNLQIIANTTSGNRDGIYFEFVTNSVIWRNISTKNIRYGLHFMFSNKDSYITNVFKNNGAGVAVMFSKEVKMFNNYFEENWGDSAYGLLLKEIADSYIFNNKFIKNTS